MRTPGGIVGWNVPSQKEHWERVYESKAPDQVSWFRPHLETSLEMVQRAAGSRSASILDVGGGASTLVDDLLDLGYRNVTVLDIAQAALDIAQKRLGPLAEQAHWLCADITQAELQVHAFDVWHDRAVFHFLTTPEQRAEYVRRAASAVKPGGHVILATFGLAGPPKCSGLEVARYDAGSLQREFGSRFRLESSAEEWHHTPAGASQQFLYCDFVLEG